jgi:hypothetical protein
MARGIALSLAVFIVQLQKIQVCQNLQLLEAVVFRLIIVSTASTE